MTSGSFDHDFLRAVVSCEMRAGVTPSQSASSDCDAQGLWSGSKPARMRASPARVSSSEVRAAGATTSSDRLQP